MPLHRDRLEFGTKRHRPNQLTLMSHRTDALVENAELQPLLPVIYIAWADGTLAQAESTHIKSIAEQLPAFDDEAQQTLDTWLDPDAPPTATELARLRRRIREQVGRRQPSLTAMSDAMNDASDGSVNEAVADYAREYGVSGMGVSAEIFQDTGEPVDQSVNEPEPSFEAAKLQTILEGDYAKKWQQVRDALAEDIFTYSTGESEESQRATVLRWLKYLATEKQDIAIGAMPESVGGQGDMAGFIHVFQALAMFDLSLVVKFGVQFGLFGGSIIFLGNDDHHQKYLPDIASGKLLGGFAMTESGHGSNVQEVETTATFDPETDEFVINTPTMSARKEWIGNAARDGHAVTLFAQLATGGENYGVHAFIVPIRTDDGEPAPGVRIEDCGSKMGLDGVDNGRLYFDNVRIPRENLLDRYASVAENGDYDSPISGSNKRFFTMLGTLVGGRISVGAASVTAAKKSLAIATRYATVRRQFGGADGSELRIIDYKTHQMRLFPAIAHTYAMHFAAFDLIARFRDRTDETAREVETLAAGIKSMASWHAIDATQTARECCGGLGFLTENQIATIRRDIDVFATFEGDNTVLLNLVSKNRLASFAKGFEQNLALTLVRELTSMARTELIDINPLTARKTDEDHLRSADFHLELLKLRKHNLLVAASRRLYKRVQQEDMEPFMAFSDIQDHMMAFAHADMDHHIAKTFADVVEPLADGPEKDALERMRQLAAIDTLLKHAEWYLTYGYISSGKYKALRNLRGALLGEIRPDALAYIEAFGIPDELLSAPIAFENYVGREPLKQAPRGERP